MDLAPLSQEEVAAVLDDLAWAVERRPRLASEPAFVGSARLALTASLSALPVEAATRPVVVAPAAATAPPAPPPTLDALMRQTLDLLAREGLTVDADLVAKFRAQLGPEPAKGRDPALVAAEAEVARLQAELARTSAKLRDVSTELTSATAARKQAEAGASTLARDLESVRSDLKAETRRVRELEGSLSEAKEAVAAKGRESEVHRTQATLVPGLQAGLRAIRDHLARIEWAIPSRFTYKTTKKPIGSCPVCSGLNPEGIAKDKDVGHRNNCWLGQLAVTVGNAK